LDYDDSKDLGRAKLLIKQGRYDEARPILRGLSRVYPENGEIEKLLEDYQGLAPEPGRQKSVNNLIAFFVILVLLFLGFATGLIIPMIIVVGLIILVLLGIENSRR
jgi:Flp pilus assembly protein TadB